MGDEHRVAKGRPRSTKAAIIYKATANLRAIQILLGHTKIESSVSISKMRSHCQRE
jgi:hypothetical protein